MLGQRLSATTIAASTAFLIGVSAFPAAADMHGKKEKPADTEQAAVTDPAKTDGHPYGYSDRAGTDLVAPETADDLRDRARQQKAPKTIVPAPISN